MRDRLLDSHFTLFFWNPPNCFMIDGRKEHCWVSFSLLVLQKSWSKVICLFSFLNIFSKFILSKALKVFLSQCCSESMSMSA